MGFFDNQEKSQAEREEEALFDTLFPTSESDKKIQEELSRPIATNETAFRALPFRAKLTFIRNFVKNYIHQEYTRFRIRRSLSK